MLTSKQILELALTEPSRKSYGGRVEAAKRSLRSAQFGAGPRMAPSSHHRLVHEMENLGRRAPSAPLDKYHHPESDRRADREAEKLDAKRRSGDPQRSYEFTGADLAWIQRLPTDPAAVSYEDAVQLAAMARASHAFTDQAGARLIQSIWAPVKEIHDAKAAELALQQARSPLPEPPAETLSALADALAEEVPDLTADEAYERGRRLLGEAQARIQAERANAEHEARAAIATAAAAKATRTSTTKVA